MQIGMDGSVSDRLSSTSSFRNARLSQESPSFSGISDATEEAMPPLALLLSGAAHLFRQHVNIDIEPGGVNILDQVPVPAVVISRASHNLPHKQKGHEPIRGATEQQQWPAVQELCSLNDQGTARMRQND